MVKTELLIDTSDDDDDTCSSSSTSYDLELEREFIGWCQKKDYFNPNYRPGNNSFGVLCCTLINLYDTIRNGSRYINKDQFLEFFEDFPGDQERVFELMKGINEKRISYYRLEEFFDPWYHQNYKPLPPKYDPLKEFYQKRYQKVLENGEIEETTD